MKKLVLFALTSIMAWSAVAQEDALKALACKSLQDAVDKSIKNTEHAKKGLKSSTWVELGDAYLSLAQQCTDDSTAIEKSENAYKKALEIENAAGGKKSSSIEEALKSDAIAQAYLMHGASYYNSKNYAKSAKYFSKSSEINPKDTTASLYAGIAYQLMEDNENALKYLSHFIDNGGKDVSVYYSIAQIYKTQKNFDKAAEVLKNGIKANPEDKDLPNELINVYLVSNNIDQAIKDLEVLVKTNPDNITNLSNLGLIYDSRSQDYISEINKITDELDDANTEKLDKKLISEQDKLSAYESELTNLNVRLKKDPKSAKATTARIADLTAQKADINEGIAKLISDIEAKKAKSANHGDLEAKLKELRAKQVVAKDNAVVNYKKVLEKDPNNFDVLYNMAVMKYNEAVETKRVVDYMDINTYRKEGKAIEDKACGQFKESLPFFERASKIKPEDEVVKSSMENIGRILEQCNK